MSTTFTPCHHGRWFRQPLCRYRHELHPKQFLALEGDTAMLQTTIQRLAGWVAQRPGDL
ncbi:MAG: hypothetical protein R3E67_07885 [Pseudomonadales bacterium]